MPIHLSNLIRIEEAQKKDDTFRALSTTYVAGMGGEDPKAFIIGEAPGAMEEAIGRPFVGPSGQVLRQLMSSAGLWAGPLSGNCWLTNVVKFRPPGNRTPTPIEIRASRKYLRKEWNAVGRPSLVITVGGTAYQAVTGKLRSILLESGQPYTFRSREGEELTLWPMIHPSYGLRNKHIRYLIEADWEVLAAWIERNL